MIKSHDRDLALVNPNWSAFVLLVTLLSVFNQIAILLLPLPTHATELMRLINNVLSLVLWADFFYLLHKSPDNWHFISKEHGWMVLLGSIPLLRFLRIFWFWLVLKANNRTFRQFLSRIVIRRDAQGTLLFVIFVVIVVFEFSTVAILGLEEAQPDGTITSVSDAIWWSLVTVSTVGYGDEYPVTNAGRIIALMLMAVGIALFSVITGTLADWFGSHHKAPPDRAPAEPGTAESSIAQMRAMLDAQESAYLETIAELKQQLAELEARLEV